MLDDDYYSKVKDGDLVVYLDNRNFGDDGARQVAQALMHPDTKAQRLWLQNNNIRNEGAKALAEALKVNSTLKALWLGNNKIGVEGAIFLAHALESNSTLQELWLGKNNIRDDGAMAFAHALQRNSTVQKLSLNKNNITKVGATAMAGVLPSNSTLLELSLDKNNIGDHGATAFAHALRLNSTLQGLWLIKNKITDEGAEAFVFALESNSSLRNLWLFKNKISEENWGKIGKSLSKENVSISANHMAPEAKQTEKKHSVIWWVLAILVVVVAVLATVFLRLPERISSTLVLGQAVQEDSKPIRPVNGIRKALVNRVVPVVRAAVFHYALERSWKFHHPPERSWSTPIYSTWLAIGGWKALVALLVLVTLTLVLCYGIAGKQCSVCLCHKRTKDGISCSKHYVCAKHVLQSYPALCVECVIPDCHNHYEDDDVKGCYTIPNIMQYAVPGIMNIVMSTAIEKEKPCPQLIRIEPHEPNEQGGSITEKAGIFLKNIVTAKVAVYCLCEITGSMGHEDPIIIDFSREWMRRLLPPLKGVLTVLQWVVPGLISIQFQFDIPTGGAFFTTLGDAISEHQEPISNMLQHTVQLVEDVQNVGESAMQDARPHSTKHLDGESYQQFSDLATNRENKPKWRPYMRLQLVDGEWKWKKKP